MEIKYPTFRWAEPRSWAGKYSWRHVQPTLIVIVHVQYRNVIHGLVLSNYEQPFTEYTLQNSPHSPRRDCRPLKLCFENCPSQCSAACLHVRGVTNTTRAANDPSVSQSRRRRLLGPSPGLINRNRHEIG